MRGLSALFSLFVLGALLLPIVSSSDADQPQAQPEPQVAMPASDAAFAVQAAGSMSCLNTQGAAVDWWIILKSNMDSSDRDPLTQAGTRYFYVDSNSYSKFSSPTTGLDSTSSPLGRTIQQVYSAPSQGYMFYNDEEPDGSTSSSKAHAKGVIGFTSSQGFWLIHSMPRFADVPPAKFSLPSSGIIYGQSYMCLSLSLAQLDDVATQLQYFNPQIYGSNMPSSLASKMPTMNALMGGTMMRDAGSNTVTLSVGGTSFVSFAKNGKWGKDLYSELVSLHFKTALACETWMRPLEPPYYDTTYAVVNVQSVNVLEYSWNEPQDHSKWAVSLSASKPVVCIGDINRQKTQWKRGGGTVCLSDKKLHSLFTSIVGAQDPASKAASSVLSSEDMTLMRNSGAPALNVSPFTLWFTLFNVLVAVAYLAM